jgi:hypothetical protein
MDNIDINVGEDGYELYIQGIDMFNAFIGILREKLRKMRNVLRKYYDIDISNPT